MRPITPKFLRWTLASLCLVAVLFHGTTARAQEFAECTQDDRLHSAAAQLAREPTETQRQALEELAQNAHFFAPTLRYWVGRGSEAGLVNTAQQWLTQQTLHRSARCAWIRYEDRAALVVAPRYVELQWTVQQSASVEDEKVLSVVIAATSGLREQSVVAMNSRGETQRFSSLHSMALSRNEHWTVQLMANDGSGIAPWAQWQIAATQPAQSAATPGASSTANAAPEHSATAELSDSTRWLHMLNHQRRREQQATLRQDLLLQTVATDRAQMLANRRQITHHLQADDSPESRLAQAGLRCERLGENVVRARSLAQAYAQLNQSPAHRHNRADAQFDSVAVGIARGSDQLYYVVELLATHPALAN